MQYIVVTQNRIKNRRQNCQRFKILWCAFALIRAAHCKRRLVSRLELLQETNVVLGEHTQVGHVIFQVGDAFDAQTKGVT